MKRLEALKLIANQIDFIHGKFYGGRTEFESQELADADIILITLEEAGMLPPQTSKPIHHYNQDALQCLTEAYHKWEPEE
jgi:hypothetical protein